MLIVRREAAQFFKAFLGRRVGEGGEACAEAEGDRGGGLSAAHAGRFRSSFLARSSRLLPIQHVRQIALRDARHLARRGRGDHKKGVFEITLIPSGGGVFEVVLDEKLIFSKKTLNRFPEKGEILNIINNQ